MASVAMCSGLVASPAAWVGSGSSLMTTSSGRVRFNIFSSAPSLRKSDRMVAMASTSKNPIIRTAEDLVEKVKQSISSAQEVCEGNETSEECVVAWDEVEELSAAAAHKRASTGGKAAKDPLEKYCEENPETDECRVYED